jgi:hypothetical protein
MPRRRLGKRERLSEEIRRVLESGDYGAGEAFSLDAFLLAGTLRRGIGQSPQGPRACALWNDHRDVILTEWISQSPGTRPFAWWILEAQEPRRCLTGVEHVHDIVWWWPAHYGIPALDQVGHFTVTIESEAAYLDRLDLLTDEERRAPEVAFEPETITVDAPTLDELIAQRERRRVMDAAERAGARSMNGGEMEDQR